MWNARFRDVLPQWGNKLSPTLVRQMELGKDTTGEAVGRALLARTQLYRKVQGWFERFDVIVTPTLARTAIPIEERLFEPIEIEGQKTDTVRKAWYPYTHPFNLTGHPAMTLPCGFHSDGLPMAIQLVGRRGEDARLFRVAALFEQARPWAGRRPAFEGLRPLATSVEDKLHRSREGSDPLCCQNMSSASLASSDMRSLSQGGSKVSLTVTWPTPATDATAFSTQTGISPATGQPGDVSVISTATLRASSTSIL